MVAVHKDYAAPTGLEFCLGCGSTKMPRLRRSMSGKSRHANFQRDGGRFSCSVGTICKRPILAARRADLALLVTPHSASTLIGILSSHG